MKRLAVRALALYLIFAVIGRILERIGMVRCGCAPDCWCQRPVLSTFRWALPYWHRSPDDDHDHSHHDHDHDHHDHDH